MPGSSFVTRVSIYYAQFKNAVSSTFLQAINAPKKKGPPDRTNIWTPVIAKNNLKTTKATSVLHQNYSLFMEIQVGQ